MPSATCGLLDDSPVQIVRIDGGAAARQPARMIRFVSAFACIAAIASASFADDPAPDPAPAPPPETAPAPAPEAAPAPAPAPAVQPNALPTREIKVEVPGERTQNNKLVIGGVAAAGLIASAVGLYSHLDSRDAANAVNADYFTGTAWNDDKVDLVDRAERSKTRAIVMYSVGGALIVGAIAAWIFTDPKSETQIIRTGGVAVTPTDDGGGMVSRMWSF